MGVKRKKQHASGVRQMLRSDGAKQARPRTSEDLFGAGVEGTLMKGEYSQQDRILELIQKRHEQGIGWIDKEGVWHRKGHDWPVPYGMRQALKTRLTHSQLVNKYPWYATWVSPVTGKRLKKKFQSLPAAIDFVASKAQYVDAEASCISRHGFYIPVKLMGKFPRRGKTGKLYYWCPCCMQPRTFRRTGDVCFAIKKFWNDEKARYDFKDVKLAVIACSTCGLTNRDSKFRASNQPLEKRRFKPGARRATKRKRTK